MRTKLLAILISAAGVGWTPAQAQPASSAGENVGSNAVARQVVDSGYVIGAGDVVEIGLIGRSDFQTRARVGVDGAIQLPMIGRVQAADRTIIQLADDVRQALVLGRYFTDPVVNAEVASISSRYVTVLGAVGSPGLVTLDRNYRLSEIVARVGGLAGGADTIFLTRENGRAPDRISFEAVAAGATDQDPLVLPGDKIFVPSQESQIVYVSGQVKTPGSFSMKPGLTVRKAIARAGGVGENGSEKKNPDLAPRCQTQSRLA